MIIIKSGRKKIKQQCTAVDAKCINYKRAGRSDVIIGKSFVVILFLFALVRRGWVRDKNARADAKAIAIPSLGRGDVIIPSTIFITNRTILFINRTIFFTNRAIFFTNKTRNHRKNTCSR